jgi:hypothetical protein
VFEGEKKWKKITGAIFLSKPAILGGTRDKPQKLAKTTCLGTRDSEILGESIEMKQYTKFDLQIICGLEILRASSARDVWISICL